MKRGVGILSPDKSMHLDLITKQDLLKVNNLQFRSWFFGGQSARFKSKPNNNYNGASPGL